MDMLQVWWAIALVATGWFLTVGAIRLAAYRSGEVDHTAGMRTVALVALILAAVSLVALIGLTVAIAAG